MAPAGTELRNFRRDALPYVMSAMIDVDLGQRRRRAIVMSSRCNTAEPSANVPTAVKFDACLVLGVSPIMLCITVVTDLATASAT